MLFAPCGVVLWRAGVLPIEVFELGEGRRALVAGEVIEAVALCLSLIGFLLPFFFGFALGFEVMEKWQGHLDVTNRTAHGEIACDFTRLREDAARGDLVVVAHMSISAVGLTAL